MSTFMNSSHSGDRCYPMNYDLDSVPITWYSVPKTSLRFRIVYSAYSYRNEFLKYSAIH